jgi:hypothetical protein
MVWLVMQLYSWILAGTGSLPTRKKIVSKGSLSR